MNSVTAILCLLINNCLVKDTSYHIALYILQNLYTIQDLSLNELASRCHTSVNSVKKFVSSLGFENYSIFRNNLQNSIEVRKSQMTRRFSNTDEKDIFSFIQALYPQMNRDDLSKTADLLIKSIQESKRIIIIGAVYPNALAVNFQEDMIVMDRFTSIRPITYDFHHDLDDVKDEDFVILVTITGSFFNIYKNRKTKFKEIKHAAVITAEEDVAKEYPNAFVVKLPSDGDNEYYNSFLLYFYELLKHRYYRLVFKNNQD